MTVNKKELLDARPLLATAKMAKIAKADVVQKRTVKTIWGNEYTYECRKYALFLRSRVDKGILRVAFYIPDHLRVGGREPVYELFVDREARRFLTYDCLNNKWSNAKLDRIDWPDPARNMGEKWITSADAEVVKKYLCKENGGYEDILSYQRDIRYEALLRRHKKETDVWDADLALVPLPPKDWKQWVNKVGIQENYLFYRYKRGGADHGYCTYCEKEVPLKGLRHNQTRRCPCCRHKVTVKSIGRLKRLDTKEACVYLVQPLPEGVVVREFWASRRYQMDAYRTPEIFCVEKRRYLYEPGKEQRYYYWGVYKQMNLRWVAGLHPAFFGYFAAHIGGEGRIYGKTLPHIMKAQPRLSGFGAWLHEHDLTVDPTDYLEAMQDVPQIEQIGKAMLPMLFEECMRDHRNFRQYIKDPQATMLTKALGIDTQQLGRLRKYNGNHFFLRWLQQEKETEKPIRDEVIQWFCSKEIGVETLHFIMDRMNALQIYNYLKRQMEENIESARWVLNTWRDYLSMAERLGMDTSDEIVYRARLLKQRHDELVLRCKRTDKKRAAQEILQKFPKVDEVCQSIREKYEYANEQFAVIAPTGTLDIIVEGDMLNHCLGSSDRYWDRIERQESYILFLRRTTAQTMPYYTLEVEPNGTIRQKRTVFDRQVDIEDIEGFLAEWQGVVAERISEEDRAKAKQSRILREKEFEQMSKDNVIIHTGDLAGSRLVDVLTADLMEAAA